MRSRFDPIRAQSLEATKNELLWRGCSINVSIRRISLANVISLTSDILRNISPEDLFALCNANQLSRNIFAFDRSMHGHQLPLVAGFCVHEHGEYPVNITPAHCLKREAACLAASLL